MTFILFLFLFSAQIVFLSSFWNANMVDYYVCFRAADVVLLTFHIFVKDSWVLISTMKQHSRRGDSAFSQVYFKRKLKSKKKFLKTLDYFLNPWSQCSCLSILLPYNWHLDIKFREWKLSENITHYKEGRPKTARYVLLRLSTVKMTEALLFSGKEPKQAFLQGSLTSAPRS